MSKQYSEQEALDFIASRPLMSRRTLEEYRNRPGLHRGESSFYGSQNRLYFYGWNKRARLRSLGFDSPTFLNN